MTAGDFAAVMAAMIADILDGSLEPNVANAASKVGSNLLKVTELNLRYGPDEGKKNSLRLTA